MDLQKSNLTVLAHCHALFRISRITGQESPAIVFWKNNVDQLLTLHGFEILPNTGKISNKEMEQIIGERYMVFDARRKKTGCRRGRSPRYGGIEGH